jgi:hypothetical protein
MYNTKKIICRFVFAEVLVRFFEKRFAGFFSKKPKKLT